MPRLAANAKVNETSTRRFMKMLLPHRTLAIETNAARVLLATEINQDAAGRVAFVSMVCLQTALPHGRNVERTFREGPQ